LGRRRAVGATIAAIILFGSLVVSNLVVVAAQQQRAQLFSLSEKEDATYDQGLALAGVAFLDILEGVQAQLTGRSIPCSGALQVVSGVVASERITVAAAGGTVNATAVLAQGPAVADNLTSLLPFAGLVPGRLDIAATDSVLVSTPGGPVTYSKTEIHHLNLPVDLSGSVTLCTRSVSQTSEALLALGAEACSSTVVQGVMRGVASKLSSAAKASGLVETLTYTVLGEPVCGVEFAISVLQNDVAGPAGPFTWRLEQSELLLV